MRMKITERDLRRVVKRYLLKEVVKGHNMSDTRQGTLFVRARTAWSKAGKGPDGLAAAEAYLSKRREFKDAEKKAENQAVWDDIISKIRRLDVNLPSGEGETDLTRPDRRTPQEMALQDKQREVWKTLNDTIDSGDRRTFIRLWKVANNPDPETGDERLRDTQRAMLIAKAKANGWMSEDGSIIPIPEEEGAEDLPGASAELEGRDGNWKFKIDVIPSSVATLMASKDCLSPADVEQVGMVVSSHPDGRNVGDKFKLVGIRGNDPVEVYETHPLVKQVIVALGKTMCEDDDAADSEEGEDEGEDDEGTGAPDTQPARATIGGVTWSRERRTDGTVSWTSGLGYVEQTDPRARGDAEPQARISNPRRLTWGKAPNAGTITLYIGGSGQRERSVSPDQWDPSKNDGKGMTVRIGTTENSLNLVPTFDELQGAADVRESLFRPKLRSMILREILRRTV